MDPEICTKSCFITILQTR